MAKTDGLGKSVIGDWLVIKLIREGVKKKIPESYGTVRKRWGGGQPPLATKIFFLEIEKRKGMFWNGKICKNIL